MTDCINVSCSKNPHAKAMLSHGDANYKCPITYKAHRKPCYYMVIAGESHVEKITKVSSHAKHM